MKKAGPIKKISIPTNLPAPESTYATKDAIFRVYRAKGLYSSEWRHSAFFKLVSIARTSYHRYGPRELFDKYDEKAAIYLVHTTYSKGDNNQELVNEWLSVRMVPGDGSFKGVGEPELYVYNKTPVTELIRKRMGYSKTQFWKHIISDSRMCGIHPYAVRNNKVIKHHTEKHAYTAESMALMQIQFMVDYPPQTIPYQFVTAIIKPQIRDKVIALQKGDVRAKPNFISAHKTLALPKGEVGVKRGIYSYRFPSYWLNMDELKSLLRRLLNKKHITQKTLQHYLDTDSLDIKEADIRIGRMLTVKGQLAGSNLTGAKLRSYVDMHVSDIPELQIIPIKTWRKGFFRLLHKAQIDIFSIHPELKSYR